jgi:hypothetical protein
MERNEIVSQPPPSGSHFAGNVSQNAVFGVYCRGFSGRIQSIIIGAPRQLDRLEVRIRVVYNAGRQAGAGVAARAELPRSPAWSRSLVSHSLQSSVSCQRPSVTARLALPRPALLRFAVGCVVVASLVGCSTRSADQPEIAPVSGTVTLDGRPLGNAKVVFQSDAGAIAFANTAADGTYELTYIRTAKGAGLGRNVVRISTPTDGPVGPNWKDPIPAAYNTASILEADVAEGRNVFDFALESKPEKTDPN